MYLCPRGHGPWETAWLAEATHCETCNPWPCDLCGERYPTDKAAYLCCRD